MRLFVYLAAAVTLVGCMSYQNKRTDATAAPQPVAPSTDPVVTEPENKGTPQPPDVVRAKGDHLEIFEQVLNTKGGFNQFNVTETAGYKKFVATWSYATQVEQNFKFKGYTIGARRGKTLCKTTRTFKWETRSEKNELVSEVALTPGMAITAKPYTSYILSLTGEIEGDCNTLNMQSIVEK